MAFEDKLTALSTAKVAAEIEFTASVQGALSAYAIAGAEHIMAEQAWLQAPASDDLRAAAAATWRKAVAARKDLIAAVDAADARRSTALTDAWKQARDSA